MKPTRGQVMGVEIFFVPRLKRSIKIINRYEAFSVAELTLSEYNSLDDYTVAHPKNREIGDIGKIIEPTMASNGQLVEIVTSEDALKIMNVLIVQPEDIK